MGLFEAQGQKAAGSHPLAEWCKQNGVTNTVSSSHAITAEMETWNHCLASGRRPLSRNRSGDISIWEVPEIDGVMRSLEYGLSDDETSDQWWELIDCATDPSPATPMRAIRVISLMRQFAEKNDYMQTTLEIGADQFDTPDLTHIYERTLEQVTELTGVDRPVLNTV